MHTTPRPGQALVIASVTFLSAVFVLQTNGVLAVDCIGKPYGYPGCPTKSSSAPSTTQEPPPNCGDNIVDADEECDMGRFNGSRQCSNFCTLLFCGDGRVSVQLGEECEPEAEEVYVQDKDTGQITTEKRFIQKTCGSYCQPPTCDKKGVCTGGCKRTFLAECPVSSAASSTPAAQATASTPVSVGAETAHPAASSVSAAKPVTFIPSPNCGNGTVDVGEQCDDGNTIPNDGCTHVCQLPRCGDSVLQGSEQCDDGNLVNSDACNNACQLARCGDGALQIGEQCDDANLSNTDACTTSCQFARCGDGIVQLGEGCDDGNQVNSDSCTNACRASTCGDGIIQFGEECDDGNQGNSDGCSNSCRNAHCGDRIIQQGEECDDGNDHNTDSCTNGCRKAECGDGIVQSGEQCDDGNQLNTDACSNLCRNAACGNGVKEASEECDDGNQVDSDGCNNVCKLPVCGNGIREEGEACDNGARNSATKANACRDDCELSRCGDAVLDVGEECDGGEECSSSCVIAPVSIVSRVFRDPVTGLLGGGFAGLSALLAFAYRESIAAFFKPQSRKRGGKSRKGSERSIDDIPLDEIEMPWHAW